jgi:VCBS repeat-containing protein
MLKIYNVDASETTTDGNTGDSGTDAVLMVQADTGSDPAGTPPSDPSSSGGAPGISVIVPDADNRVTLAASASIEDIQLDGNDLLLVQPDGSQIRIIGGALSVPTFIIGDIELPQEVLVAALETSGFNVAAGPGNTLSVSPQAPTGSGGEFEDSSGASIAGDGLNTLSLLGDTSGAGDGGAGAAFDEDTGNIASVLTGGVSSGGIVESVDNPGGVDADPVAATGSITFFDPDFGEIRTAEITASNVVSQTLNNGGTLTAAQLDALLAGFSFDTPGGITVESTTAAGGSIDWTYAVGNEAVDFLAAGEVITLAFDVRINDGVLSTTQTVTVTVTGTNDQPVIEGTSVLAGTITEQTGTTGSITPLTATGEIALSDVDLTDTHTTNQTFVSAVWSGGADQPFDPGRLLIEAVDQAAGTARWTYTVADNALDFLAAGETLTITYDVIVRDSSAIATAGSALQQVVVTITGTNDRPVITSGAQTGSVEETADVVGGADPDPAAATGIISFLDVDLSDDPEASHDGRTVTNMSFADGYTPTDAQLAALRAGFSLDDAALSNFSNTTGAGSTGWTYQVANDVVDFLGDGDSVELTYVVTIDDGKGGTVTHNVVVTVIGTSDAPTVSAADDFVVSEEDLTNGNSDALIFTGDVGLNFNDYSSVGLSTRLKTSGAIPLDSAGNLILLSSDGLQLGYSLLTRPSAGQQILSGFNFRTGEIIFVLDVKIVADGSGGFKVEYTFELRGNLDHVGPGDGASMPLDFTVTATNSAGETAENTFTVTINDDAPDAANVTATMEENMATLISLVEGDGADLEPGEAYISGADDVTVTLGTPTYSNLPAGVVPGTPGLSLVQNATGYDVSITPGTAFDALAEGESLLMEIPFTVEDGDGDTVAKVITVTVTGTNDQPVISAQTDVSEVLTETDAAVSTTGSFDVSDADVSDVLTITDVTVAASGTGVNAAMPDSATLLALFGPSSGVAIDGLSNTGTVNWTFDAGSGVFDYLKAGESLELTYTVNVADGHGGTVEQDIAITIQGTNDAPVISPVTQPAAVAEAGDAATQDIAPVSGTLSVTDLDAGDTLTAQAGTPVISWSGGTLSAAQQSALMAALGTGALTLGTAVSNGGAAGIGYSWDPAAADLDFLAESQTLTVRYDVSVSDGSATSAAQPLIFTIAGTNDLPVARNDNPNGSLPDFRISEDATVARVFDVLGNDTLDVDAGSANNISLGTIRGYGVPGFASGGILDPLTSGFFTITVDVNNRIQVELNSSAWQSMRRGETAKIVIDYQLHGDGSDAATGSLQVEVTGSNDAPLLDAAVSPTMTQAEDAGLPSGNVGTLVSTLVSAPGGSIGNVNDVDGKTFAPGMSITAFDTSQGVWYYHLDGVNAPDGRPYWFNANLAPGQVLNLRAQDQLYFAPSADYVGTVDPAITFRAWDGVASQLGKISAPGSVGGGTAYSAETDTVSLTVENVNDAPVLETNIADATVFANTALDIDVSGSFSDVDPGDVLSFSATLAGGNALPAWLSIDATTGRLTGTPPSVGVAGETLEVVVTATDRDGLAASDTFELTIDSAPVAPVITAHTDGGVTEDASFAGGTNLITNGGFETGTTSGWSASNSYVSSYHYYIHSGVYGDGWTTFYTKDVPFTYSQSFGTVAGTTYTISFWVENKGFSSTGEIDNSVLVTWDGATVGSVIDLAYATGTSNFTEYSYTFTASSATSTLALAVTNNVGYTYIDDVSVVQLPGTETAAGTISFTDDDVGETHTVSFAPSAAGYFGTFSAALATESSGGSTGRVEWTFNVADADIQHLAAGETVSQIYTVTIDDGNGGTVSEDIEVVLTGADEAPILGTAGDDVLLGDAGAELLNGGSGSDILYGGGEADTFVFDDDALADAGANIRDLIADYDFAEGDVVDLSSLLGGETVVGHAADYVKMNGTFLEVDVDGTAGGAGFVRIAEFNDVPATNGLRILVDDDPADVTVVI